MQCCFASMKFTAQGESLMTNIALGFVLYLPLDSHLEQCISYKLVVVV